MKSIAVLQSCYVPWKGYFDLIAQVDEFVLYDDQQFTKNDWRNRNRIKTPQGVQWLTIPVRHERLGQRIDETRVAQPWTEQHWRTLEQNYGRAAHFAASADSVRAAYRDLADEPFLSVVNRRLLDLACGLLGIGTPLTSSSEYAPLGDRVERLLDLCAKTGAGRYVTGPAAGDYLDEERFAAAGVEIVYMDYAGYPEYPQLHPPFEHAVTILDLLFNTGPDARRYLKAPL